MSETVRFITDCHNAECCYAGCLNPVNIFSVIMPSVVNPSVSILSTIYLGAAMLSFLIPNVISQVSFVCKMSLILSGIILSFIKLDIFITNTILQSVVNLRVLILSIINLGVVSHYCVSLSKCG
jgi:hypothetical protein